MVETDTIRTQIAPLTARSYAELLKEGRLEEVFDKFSTWGIGFLVKLTIGIILFIIGRFLIRKFKRFIHHILNKQEVDTALKGFLQSLVETVLYIALFIFIFNTVGKTTISIAALLGSAALAIGLAVKDNLANFAGGVMILLNKPFRGGDFIKAQGVEGVVQSIGVLYTTLRTFDNQMVFVPNGPLSTGTITNINAIDKLRRIEIIINVDYGSDVERVKQLLLNIALAHPKVLKDPAPFARMTDMNDSSIDFTWRAWTLFDDFFDTKCDLNEEAYKQLTANGFNIPYPQMTVHLANQ